MSELMAPKPFSHQYLLAPTISRNFQQFRISGSIVYRQLLHSFTDVALLCFIHEKACFLRLHNMKVAKDSWPGFLCAINFLKLGKGLDPYHLSISSQDHNQPEKVKNQLNCNSMHWSQLELLQLILIMDCRFGVKYFIPHQNSVQLYVLTKPNLGWFDGAEAKY